MKTFASSEFGTWAKTAAINYAEHICNESNVFIYVAYNYSTAEFFVTNDWREIDSDNFAAIHTSEPRYMRERS